MNEKAIAVRFGGGLRVDAEYHGFTIKTDQPFHQGGEGSAPAPFDLFLASLATCAGFYVLAFCLGRKLSTDGIEISMAMEKDPATKMIAKITIRVDLPPGFPEKYKDAIAKAVDHCAVKSHILKPPSFETVVGVKPTLLTK
jgi:ribosomal protein S12 methylthiotransferase accessory factor